MNRVISILLAFIVLLPNLSKMWIVIDFKVRQEYIAQTLCVNRDEPVPMCQGACYLNGQLQKADEQGHDALPHGMKVKPVWIFEAAIPALPLLPVEDVVGGGCHARYAFLYVPPIGQSIFHPPQVG